MKMLKILAAGLFFTTVSYAAVVDKEHPFLFLGTNEDHSISFFIGAYEGFLPQKIPNGNILLHTMIQQDVEAQGQPKGQQYEFIMLVDCAEATAKALVIWKKDKEGVPGKPRWDLKGDQLEEAIIKEMNLTKTVDLDLNSMMGISAASGCHFLGTPIKSPTQKKAEWNAML